MTLYDRIKKIADDKSITIAYIEESVNISNGSIAKWKLNTPKADNLYKVANFLGCSVEFLIASEYEDNSITNLDNNFKVKEKDIDYKLFLNENEIEILDILRKFPDDRSQIKFIARAEALAEEMLANIEDKK